MKFFLRMCNEYAAKHLTYCMATISLLAQEIYFTENDGVSIGEIT